MQGESIQDFLVSGVPLLALLPIPVLGVICAVALGIGLARRNLVLAIGAISLAAAVGVVAEGLRAAAADPAAVDALVMQLPIALAVGGLPAIARLAQAFARAVGRRVRTIEVDSGFGSPVTIGASAPAE